jgi:hypothetical protein
MVSRITMDEVNYKEMCVIVLMKRQVIRGIWVFMHLTQVCASKFKEDRTWWFF